MKIEVSDVIIIGNNKVLMVQQRKKLHYGLWGFPGGKLEQRETPLQAAIREVKEEVGVMLAAQTYIKTYEFENSAAHVKQHVFIGKTEGSIVLNDDELMAYGWFSTDSIELLRNNLRSPVIFEQAISALKGNL